MLGRILIAEDHELTRENVRDACIAEGYEVLVATNGREALDKAQATQLDAIILDIRMPEMDGYEVCRELRALPASARTPILVFSAFNDREHFKKVALLANNYAVKPVELLKSGDLDELLARLWDEIVAHRLQPVTQTLATFRYHDDTLSYESNGLVTVNVGAVEHELRPERVRRALALIERDLFAHHAAWLAARRAGDRDAEAEALDARHTWREKAVELGQELYERLIADHPTVMRAWGQAQYLAQLSETLALRFCGPRTSLAMPFPLLHEGSRPLATLHPIFHQVDGLTTQREAWRAFLAGQRNRTVRALFLAGADWAVEEVTRAAEGLRAALARVDVRVETYPADLGRPQTRAEAEALLQGGSYQLLHFAGHSDLDRKQPEESFLVFADGGRLLATRLDGLLRRLPLQFLYLSSCSGADLGADSMAAGSSAFGLIDAALQASVPAALGYRWPVVSRSARQFADYFYEGLSLYPTSLEHALWWARRRSFEGGSAGAGAARGWDETWFSPTLVIQSPHIPGSAHTS